MACPLLRRAPPHRCRAVDGASAALPGHVLSAYCRGAYAGCPAYRFLRAAGRPVHPSDFTSWVVRGIGPGRTTPVAPSALDLDGP